MAQADPSMMMALPSRPVDGRRTAKTPQLLLAAALLVLVHRAAAAPFSVEDNFVPACGGLLPDPPPGGWKLWSSAATWQGGPVPGIGGSTGVNVTIPCGVGVLLDLPLVQLTVVSVLGALKFKDDPSLPLVNLTASFIIVEGRFIIGSSVSQFRQRAEIRLAPNPFNRTQYAYTAREPADPANPRVVGHKAFAVLGGQVDFHGLPGNANTLSWTRLLVTARAGDSRLIVKGDVSAWPAGAPLVVAPTDFYPDQEDVRIITAVTCAAGGQGPCNITLDKALAYNHFGDPLGVPDGFGGYIDETAEVALLTRRIVVTGTDEPAPYQLEGGHFIVYMTNTQQILEGVQFLMMGQQGKLGRYNIHFHLCGDQDRNSIVRKNLMMHSKQRCVIAHVTFNLRVEGNVAYNTSGHCYILEEGSETGNTFVGNLGLRTRAVVKKIADDETDDSPATFWVTNPNNSYINNSAAGSEDSGFWMELRSAVRGLSLQFAKVNNTVPISVTSIGTFSGNTAHSNLFAGYRQYPHGFTPRFNSTPDNRNFDKPVWVEIGGFNLWKNNQVGAFLHSCDHVVFSNSTLADNIWGVHMHQVQGVNVTRTRVVGESRNLGNPSNCQAWWGKWTCGPVSTCAFPLSPGDVGRGVSWGMANQTVFGVVYDQNRQNEDGHWENSVTDSTFSAFDDTCHPAAAVAVSSDRGSFWNTGNNFRGLKFDTANPTNKLYFMNKTQTEAGDGWIYYGGEPSTMFALEDEDGSILGASGYAIANNPFLRPPPSVQCAPLPRANAYTCPGTCYRTVQITYDEPGFFPYPEPAKYGDQPDGNRTIGDYSYLKVIRIADGNSATLEGNLRQYRTSFDNGAWPYADSARIYPMTLLGGYTYEVTLVGPTGNPSFVPSNLTITYKDGDSPCPRSITLRVRGSASVPYSWAVLPSDIASWVPCPGTSTLTTAVAPVQFSYACANSTSPPQLALEILLSLQLPAVTGVVVVPTKSAPGQCSVATRCSVTAVKTVWFYNQLNQNLHPAYSDGPAFYNPLYPTVAPDWQSGPGPLGFEGWNWWAINTFLNRASYSSLRTYYFKTSFSLTRSGCYSTLYVDAILQDGFVLYLNNKEILRVNMPAGTPDNMTSALTKMEAHTADWATYNYTTFVIPLTNASAGYALAEGANYLAAEVHVYADDAWNVGWGVRASLDLDSSCHKVKSAPEVCDGVDNDGDGTVDLDPVTKLPLTRPCLTPCGVGAMTCVQGSFQACTAPPAKPEVCNGKDDNCDGLVDNGLAQLDCSAGQACFAGKCQPVQALTTAATVWAAQTSGWLYQEAGADMTGTSWVNGTKPNSTLWRSGTGPFGIFPNNATWTFSTNLTANSNGKRSTRYFVRSFTLETAATVSSTFGYTIDLRRCDGAVVYLNGRELFRSNMPAGPVTYATLASQWSAGQDPTWDQNAVRYYQLGPLEAFGAPSVLGTNWIAAEVHGQNLWQTNSVFDMGVTRHVLQACPSGVPCVRYPPKDSVFISPRDPTGWRYLDASSALPPDSWKAPSFNDSAWTLGQGAIGQGGWGWFGSKLTFGSDVGNGRVAYYFRKTLNIPDGACFYNLTLTVLNNDGCVVYFNGVEALRYNMPAGNITATTPAVTYPAWKYVPFSLSQGWLKNGLNVIAIELHQSMVTSKDYVFDATLSGQREGAACSPPPP